MKTVGTQLTADGTTNIAHYWYLENHGLLACQLLGYFINGEAVKCALEEGKVDFDPKKLAVIACDLAEAMYAEMDARDWILKLPKDKDENKS